MNDAKLRQAMDEFFNRRLNDHGRKEPQSVQDAWSELKARRDALKEALSPEHNNLINACENALMILDGETRDYFYRAGFSDAVFFLLKWRDME